MASHKLLFLTNTVSPAIITLKSRRLQKKPIPPELKLLDPIKELAPILPSPLGGHLPYQHDGGPAFLLGVVDPINMRKFLTQQAPQPPASAGTPRTPNLTIALETLVRTLRDAEILAEGAIPENCVNHRFEVY